MNRDDIKKDLLNKFPSTKNWNKEEMEYVLDMIEKLESIKQK